MDAGDPGPISEHENGDQVDYSYHYKPSSQVFVLQNYIIQIFALVTYQKLGGTQLIDAYTFSLGKATLQHGIEFI